MGSVLPRTELPFQAGWGGGLGDNKGEIKNAEVTFPWWKSLSRLVFFTPKQKRFFLAYLALPFSNSNVLLEENIQPSIPRRSSTPSDF